MNITKVIDNIITKKEPELVDKYIWQNGQLRTTGEYAEVIMHVLESTGKFGPMRYNPEAQRIEFGRAPTTHTDKFSHSYQLYCEAFRRVCTLN